MSQPLDRREFFGRAAAGGLAMGLLVSRSAPAQAAADTVVVGVMGLSRGRSLAVSFAQQPGVVVKYVCDTDQSRAESAAKLLEGAAGKAPQTVGDFRRMLDDSEVDVLISPRRITGTPRRRFWPARQASTCTSRSRAATIPTRAS